MSLVGMIAALQRYSAVLNEGTFGEEEKNRIEEKKVIRAQRSRPACSCKLRRSMRLAQRN